MSHQCDQRVLDRRFSKDFSTDTLSAIHKVTVNMNTLPVGTFKYKVFKYPGDIDLFEIVEGCCTFNDTRLKASEAIQSIAKNIETDNLFFSDFKAGYDYRFKIYTGIIGDQIMDYNADLIRRDFKNLLEANLLSCDEYQNFIKLVPDVPNLEGLIKLNEDLRDLWVLRWSLEEILQGYKVLRGNYKLYLDTALTQGTIVKLDVIAKLTGDSSRYVEITNFFMIKQRDRYGNEIILTEELEDYDQSLLGDVYKYYDHNTLKAVKRLWMYLAFKKDICDLSIFTPLFSSKIAYYGQIISDIDVAITLLNSKLPYSTEFLFKSIQPRIANLDKILLTPPVYTNPQCMDPKILSSNLLVLKNNLQETVNSMTQKWLKDNNIDIFELI